MQELCHFQMTLTYLQQSEDLTDTTDKAKAWAATNTV